MVALFNVPLSPTARLELIQSAPLARFVFCCKTKFVAEDGHERITFPAKRATARKGGGGCNSKAQAAPV